MLVPVSAAGVIDSRVRFRDIFCAVNRQIGRQFPDYRRCADALVPAAGDPPITEEAAGPLPAIKPRTLVIVPGFLMECVADIASPFSDARDYLEKTLGFRVLTVNVEGRSSSRRNAQIIDRFMGEEITDSDEVVVIAHSKGVPDFLEALTTYSDAPWVQHVQALVSVAGAVNGSPLAEDLPGLVEYFLEHLPSSRCGPGDDGGIASLTRQQRLLWLSSARLPPRIAFFSLAAIPATAPVSPWLSLPHWKLSRIDPRNDGQVLAQDAVLPRSYLLGFANADHWAVAIPFNRNHDSVLAGLLADANAYPREVLIISLLGFVEETLEHLQARPGPLRDRSGPAAAR